jgi:4-hydroxy-2-oxoheptanedioate aldolase
MTSPPAQGPHWLDGDLVGGWCQLPGSATAELLASVGFDYVCIDTQHGLIGDDVLLTMLQALSANATRTLVRVSHNDHAVIGRALDRGADGVIVPLVNSAAEAAAAVAACRFPPTGNRSLGPTRVTWRGRDPLTPMTCIVMIETAESVEALPEILAVDHLDGIFVGPSDLALSTGHALSAQSPGPGGNADYFELLGSIVTQCRGAGKPVGIFSASPAHVRRFREVGFTFFALSSDAAMLRAAATDLLAASRRGCVN